MRSGDGDEYSILLFSCLVVDVVTNDDNISLLLPMLLFKAVRVLLFFLLFVVSLSSFGKIPPPMSRVGMSLLLMMFWS